MDQADSVHSTPPTNTSVPPLNATSAAPGLLASATAELCPDRRIFLAQAAGSLVFAATAGTALGATTDPIFAAIENHKAAFNHMNAVLSEHSRLESILPREKTQIEHRHVGKKK
jgi:hypothetical protein